MHIENKENLIYILDEEKEVGHIEYKIIDHETIDVIHTFVSSAYRGQGIAGKLFEELMTYVKDNHLQVIPSCSYIRKKLENSEVYREFYKKM